MCIFNIFVGVLSVIKLFLWIFVIILFLIVLGVKWIVVGILFDVFDIWLFVIIVIL